MPAPQFALLSDSLRGGAAVAATRLAHGLQALGRSVQQWHMAPPAQHELPHQLSLAPRRPRLERIIKNFSRRGARRLRHYRQTDLVLKHLQESRPLLLNIHNIHDSGLDHLSISKMPVDLPIVWTMHDAWPVCPEAFEWQNSALQQRETVEPNGSGTTHAQAIRELLFTQFRPLILVSPSQWLLKFAREKMRQLIRMECIPNGIDLRLFQPQDKLAARQFLSLNLQKIWIGHGSTWNNSRKGSDIFWNALPLLPQANIGIVCWGKKNTPNLPSHIEVKDLGEISGEQAMATALSACDLFVCPSRADNLPNSAVESLACGTPVIGANVGGIPEIVSPGVTGWLFDGDLSQACAQAISTAISQRAAWPEFSLRARAFALANYNQELQAQRYLDLFNQLLNPARRPA